jgi:membrane protein insertase Oxa1/YidC/SpoIIIJ
MNRKTTIGASLRSFRSGSSRKAGPATTSTRLQSRSVRQACRGSASSADGLGAVSGISKVSPGVAMAFPAMTLPSFDVFTPLSTMFLSHPLPTYTGSIIVLTLLTRTLITLPITIWSRAHMVRLRKIVAPILKRKNTNLALSLVPECRKLGLTHKEYVQVLQGEIKKARKETLKEYGVRPRLTAFLPPLVHLPIFLGLSLTIREATRLATELNTVSISANLSGENDAEAMTQQIDPQVTQTGLDNAASILANTPDMTTHLAAFLQEHPFHLTSLIDSDSSLILPFIVGIAAFSNVELMQTWRDSSRSLSSNPGSDAHSNASGQRGKTGKIVPDPRRETPRPKRSVLEDAPAVGDGVAGEGAEKREEAISLSSRIIGFALRGLAVASVGFAAEAPAVSSSRTLSKLSVEPRLIQC